MIVSLSWFEPDRLSKFGLGLLILLLKGQHKAQGIVILGIQRVLANGLTER